LKKHRGRAEIWGSLSTSRGINIRKKGSDESPANKKKGIDRRGGPLRIKKTRIECISIKIKETRNPKKKDLGETSETGVDVGGLKTPA